MNAVPASGSLFPAGRTTVNCSASDGTNVVNGSFDVFVCVNPPAPATVWVDDNWVGLPNGTDVGSSRTIGCDAFATIQGGVTPSPRTGTVNVAAGSYVEDVSSARSSASSEPAPASDVRGPIGGAGATFQFTVGRRRRSRLHDHAPGQQRDRLEQPGLNSAGVAIQGRDERHASRQLVITGNRTGIDINNSTGITVHNNVIDDNRTGLIFRNVRPTTARSSRTRSSNNWTVGVLFLDAQRRHQRLRRRRRTARRSRGNNISGNWYGQIVDRQIRRRRCRCPGTNLKNFSGNWFGTVTPVITTANSAEPGYAAQIPVAFGGGATPPGGQPDIAGPASANFDITPLLESGTDTDVSLGHGLRVPGRLLGAHGRPTTAPRRARRAASPKARPS